MMVCGRRSKKLAEMVKNVCVVDLLWQLGSVKILESPALA